MKHETDESKLSSIKKTPTSLAKEHEDNDLTDDAQLLSKLEEFDNRANSSII